jgi:quercetin dioxygenase-like cupin family protein
MPTIGKRLTTPGGDVIEFLETSASTDGARVRTRALLKLEGLRAALHMHKDQDETYEVISGKLTYVLDGKEHVAEAGSTVVLPRGVGHQHYCHGPDDTVVIQSMTPGLDFDYLLESITGLASEGPHPPDSLWQGLVWVRKMKGPLYLPSLPIWFQRGAASIATPTLYLFGYRAVYKQFSGEEW